MVTEMRYGFLDEAGGAAPFSGSRFLVVAVFTTSVPRPIELHVKRARKRLREKPASGEIKATHSREAVIKRLLTALAQEDIQIVAEIIDKRAILRPPEDYEDIYRLAVASAVRHCVTHWPRLDLYLDKRYTKKALRYILEKQIREAISDLRQEVILISQEDSVSRKELQAVDYVVWAIFQKYERADERFYRIIADKIVVEEVLKQSLW
ncbi:MAG: DUF3800 domain-containing protein [Chloroflexi bacterium]|nr:DUF3800 domain-containing protein [Chloroflexota bacterium]